jgi:hypothetical protein
VGDGVSFVFFFSLSLSLSLGGDLSAFRSFKGRAGEMMMCFWGSEGLVDRFNFEGLVARFHV